MDNNIINNYADKMLNRIKSVVRDELSDAVLVEGAIVNKVNKDGTVDVYIPPDDKIIFTKISNQTPFELQSGDSVEIMLKNGSYNNCWITAKHSVSNGLNINQKTQSANEVTQETLQSVLNNFSNVNSTTDTRLREAITTVLIEYGLIPE